MTFRLVHRYDLGRVARIALLLVASASVVASAATPVYKCPDRNLGVLYTDEPCRNGERLDLRAGDADPAAVAWLERQRDALDRSSAQRIADERRASLQRQYAMQPEYVAEEPYPEYADAAAYIPYGYGYMAPYPATRPRADGVRHDRRSRSQHVVPVEPRGAPRM
jgi:hypothetical protein